MNAEQIDARLTILVTKARKRQLEAEARAKKTTVGAIVRRRIEGEPNEEERAFLTALVELGQRIEKVNADMDAIRATMARDEAAAAGREQAARSAALAHFTEQDVRAVAGLIAPAVAHAAQRERERTREAV